MSLIENETYGISYESTEFVRKWNTNLSLVKKRPRKRMSASEEVMLINVYKQTYKTSPVADFTKKIPELLAISATTLKIINMQ